NVIGKGGAFAKTSTGTGMFARRSPGFRRLGAQPHDRSAIGGTSENRFGMSGREAGQHGGPELEGAAEHGDRLASALCSGGNSGIAGPSAIGQTAAIYREFRKQVLATLEEPPPKGQAVWDGPALAEYLKTSVHAVWRVLRVLSANLRNRA